MLLLVSRNYGTLTSGSQYPLRLKDGFFTVRTRTKVEE